MNNPVLRIAHEAPRVTKGGFTLVELLISVVIVALVGTAVYAVFANGINAWRRGMEIKIYERKARLTLEKIARELRNSFKFSNIAFEGEEDFLRFPALISAASDSSRDPESHYEVGRITYFYDKKGDALCKKEEIYPEVFDEKKRGFAQKKVLIQQLRELKLSYCYFDNATGNYKWKDDWKKEEQDTIPQAVKIKMIFEEGKGLPKESFEKTIFIPVGSGEQKIELSK